MRCTDLQQVQMPVNVDLNANIINTLDYKCSPCFHVDLLRNPNIINTITYMGQNKIEQVVMCNLSIFNFRALKDDEELTHHTLFTKFFQKLKMKMINQFQCLWK